MKQAFFAILLFSLLAACAPAAIPTPTAAPTASVTLTPAPTQTPTPLPTGTPTLAFTPTAVPTLPAEDARKRLLELLANNGDCRLPCLWGITPGKSTSQEAQVAWSPLSGINSHVLELPAYFTMDDGAVRPSYTEGGLMLNTEARYQSNNHIVSRINFFAREQQKFVPSTGGLGLLNIFDSTTFGKRVDYYSLSHVLSEQGIPDAVMIAASGEPTYEGGGGFEIALLYPEQGIWVNYTTQMYFFYNPDRAQGCPANAHVEMELFPSGDADSFSASLKQYWAEKAWFQPLEKVTNMTLRQFYETFRQPTNKCIETPAKFWPTPKPGGGG
jgi:hypothetical protein